MASGMKKKKCEKDSDDELVESAGSPPKKVARSQRQQPSEMAGELAALKAVGSSVLLSGDELSLGWRAMGSGPAAGVLPRWISCVYHQMTSELDKMQRTEKGKEDLSQIHYYICKSEEEMMDQIGKWLRNNQETTFVMGPERKGPGRTKLESQVTDKNLTGQVSVDKFCRRRYKLSIDEYIDKLKLSSAPGYELACFAIAQQYTRVRLAVLRPESVQAEVSKQWQIWDSGQCKRPSQRILLRIADTGSQHFVSLVPDADWATHLAEQLVDDSNESGLPDDIGDGDSTSEPPTPMIKLDRLRSQCAKCGKFRLFKRVSTAGQYECQQNDMEMEKSCDDPPIYEQIRIFAPKRGFTKKIDGKPLNLAYLFCLAQAAGSLEELIKQRKLPETAKLLGATPRKATAEGKKVQKAYESVFRQHKVQGEGGLSLEQILQRDPGVIKTIEKRGPKLRKSLGIPEKEKHRISEIAEAQQLPEIFSGIDRTPTRSEHITRIMREVGDAASQWDKYADRRVDRGERRPKWAGAVGDIIDLARKVGLPDCKAGDLALAMLGNTGIGKSFLMDCILRMSEGNRSRYADEVASSERVRGIEAKVYLQNLQKNLPAAEEVVDASIVCEMYEADATRLNDYCSPMRSSVLKKEMDAVQEIASYCIDKQSRADFPSFLLPSFRPTSSTTACAICSKRGGRYQLVLEYRSKEELIGQWKKYNELKRSKKKVPQRKAAMMESQVVQAMDLSADEDPEQRKNARLKAKRFLDDFANLQDSTSQNCKLAELVEFESVLGKRMGFAGAGVSAIQDRIIIRALLHTCQGIRDDFTHEIDIDPMTAVDFGSQTESGLHFCRGSGDDRVRFGLRTFAALKKITLFAPCDILPVSDSEWVDLPGCEDGCPIKQSMLNQELIRAEAVIALVEKNLKGSEATAKAVSDSLAFRELVTSVQGGRNDKGRISLLCNLEKTLSVKSEKVTPAVLQQYREGGDIRDGRLQSAEQIKTSVEECVRGQMEDEEVNDLGDRVCEQIQHTLAAFKFATSVVMHTDQRQLDERSREELLERSGIFELLGVVEKFLRSGTCRTVENILQTFDKQIVDLEDQLKQSAGPASAHRPAQSHKKAGNELWNGLEGKAQDDSWLDTLESKILENDGEWFATLDLDTAQVSEEVKECPYDEYDDVDNETLCEEFATAVHKHTLKLFKSKLKDLKERMEPDVVDSVSLTLQNLVVTFVKEYCGQQLDSLLDKGVEDTIRKLVDEQVRDRAKTMAKEIHDAAIKRVTAFPKNQLLQLAQEVSEHMEEKDDMEDRWDVLVQHLDFFVTRLKKRIQSGMKRDLDLERTNKQGSPRPAAMFFCKMGLEQWPPQQKQSKQVKASQIRGNSLRRIAIQLATELEPTARIGQSRDETAQIQKLADSCRNLKRTLQTVLSSWQDDSDLTRMGRKLVNDFRLLRQMESFAERRGCGDLLPKAAARDPVDKIPKHSADGQNVGGYVDFKLSELEKVWEDEAEATKLRVSKQLKSISERDISKLNPARSSTYAALIGGTRSDPDLLFKQYAAILGQSVSSESVRECLRDAVAQQAFISANADPQIKQYLESEKPEGVWKYSERMQQSGQAPDLLALVLLVHFFERPLNLYVPWSDNPRRISPQKEADSDSSERANEADALVLAGWVQPKSKGSQGHLEDERMLVFIPIAENRSDSLRSAGAERDQDQMEVDHLTSVSDAESEARGGSEAEEEDPLEEGELREDTQTSDSLYSYATFSVASWTRSGEDSVCLGKEMALSFEQFRAVSVRFAQFAESFVYCKRARTKHYADHIPPYDDAFAQCDDVLGVFDGLEHSGASSGKFARLLANYTSTRAKQPVESEFIRLDENDYNRSEYVLDTALKEACAAHKRERLRAGASTAVVLSLIQRRGENQLHEAVQGDSQWVLLRKNGPKKYCCEYVSERMYSTAGHFDPNDPPPQQLRSDAPTSLHQPHPLNVDSRSVKDEDIVILGTPGFFNVFLPFRKLPDKDQELEPWDHEEKYVNDLKKQFTKYANELALAFRRQESQSQDSFFHFFARHLSHQMKRQHNMLPAKNTEDMTIVMAVVREGVSSYKLGKRPHPLLDPRSRKSFMDKMSHDGAEEYHSLL